MEIKTQEQQVLLHFKLCYNSGLALLSPSLLGFYCGSLAWRWSFPFCVDCRQWHHARWRVQNIRLQKEGTIINLGFKTSSGVQLLLQWFYIPQVSSPGTLTSPTPWCTMPSFPQTSRMVVRQRTASRWGFPSTTCEFCSKHRACTFYVQSVCLPLSILQVEWHQL